MLTNPFTGLTINSWSDAARAASAVARRTRRLGQSQSLVSKLLQEVEAARKLVSPSGFGVSNLIKTGKKYTKARRIQDKAMARYLKSR